MTGASSGIGLVTAQALVNAGYRVFGTSRKPVASSPGVTMLICDVTDEASVRALIEEIMRQAGRIDLVVNNAGGSAGHQGNAIFRFCHVINSHWLWIII